MPFVHVNQFHHLFAGFMMFCSKIKHKHKSLWQKVMCCRYAVIALGYSTPRIFCAAEVIVGRPL